MTSPFKQNKPPKENNNTASATITHSNQKTTPGPSPFLMSSAQKSQRTLATSPYPKATSTKQSSFAQEWALVSPKWLRGIARPLFTGVALNNSNRKTMPAEIQLPRSN